MEMDHIGQLPLMGGKFGDKALQLPKASRLPSHFGTIVDHQDD